MSVPLLVNRLLSFLLSPDSTLKNLNNSPYLIKRSSDHSTISKSINHLNYFINPNHFLLHPLNRYLLSDQLHPFFISYLFLSPYYHSLLFEPSPTRLNSRNTTNPSLFLEKKYFFGLFSYYYLLTNYYLVIIFYY